MQFLDKLRGKPLEERKRIVWISAFVCLGIIVVVSVIFFREWTLPIVTPDDREGIEEFVGEAEEVIDKAKQENETIEKANKELEEQGRIDLLTELEIPSKTKNHITIGLMNWSRQGAEGIVSLNFINYSDKPVLLREFVVTQGFGEITSAREIPLEVGEEKDVEITFELVGDEPVSGFKINSASFSEEGEEESWEYIFRIKEEIKEEDADTKEAAPTDESN